MITRCTCHGARRKIQQADDELIGMLRHVPKQTYAGFPHITVSTKVTTVTQMFVALE
jgi:hypothetical protein